MSTHNICFQATSNEYLQHLFLWWNMKKYLQVLVKKVLSGVMNGSTESRASVGEQQMPWSDCVNTQTNMGLPYSNMAWKHDFTWSVSFDMATKYNFSILVLMNLDLPCLCKQCRSRSVGFRTNLDLHCQQPGLCNLIGWQLEMGVAS